MTQPSHEPSGREPATVPPAGLSRTGIRWLALCLAVVLAAGVGWLVLRPARHGGSSTSNTAAEYAGPSQDEISAVMQLLGRHAEELLRRDRPAWTADLDDASAADGYTGQQRAVFDNLAGVPLASWRYLLTAPVTDPTVLEPAAQRLGGRVVVLHVQLEYGFALADPTPTAKGLWLTAVRRAGGWRLASDSDAAADGGASWHGPWDFGPLKVRSGPHTLVLAHPAHQADAARFEPLVEAAVPVVTSVWGKDWNDHVVVLIPDTTAEFVAVSGDSADSHDLAAVAVADAVDPDGTVLGARVVLNPTTLSELDAAGRRLVVQHELTHLASQAATSDQMPTWLIEGFADYVGNLGSGQSVRTAATELGAEIRRGVLPAALPTNADFDGGNGRLAQVYEESWLACRLIASRIGQQGLVRFYKLVGSAARTDPGTAAALGLRQLLHTDLAAFTAAWRAALIAQLR
ncbi:MAG: hypothetical protein M3Y42_20960 [Actinomycetota bacterium]|nr:hypothetical protein [Actinomycetota bacterium]MDQ2959419.1 hypothetical protein [Actinomycetota bacterium]